MLSPIFERPNSVISLNRIFRSGMIIEIGIEKPISANSLESTNS